MKRLFLIVLIMCFVASIAIPVLARATFGSWKKWDEQLPPAEHQSWYWAIKTNEPRVSTLKDWGEAGSDIVLLFSDIYFFGDKKGKTKASILFYSLGDVDKKDWDIPNADLALAAFPPKKGKMIIRAYQNGEAGFKFFEEWKILFKKNKDVVPEDAKFRQIFKEWLEKQVASDKTIPEDMINFMLPKLTIFNKKDFIILNVQPNK